MNRSTICTLEEALRYQNDDIVDRFLGMYDMPFEEAEKIFLETKKWVWLSATASQERHSGGNVPRLIIDNFLIFIDEMWHNFILFTKEYHDYCMNKFGFFIHHNPTPRRIKEAMKVELSEGDALTVVLGRRKEQYSYIYDKLGADTLELWYGILCDKYTQMYFNRIRK